MALILNRLPHTGIRYVVVVALATERIPAALPVTALRYRKFAAQRPLASVFIESDLDFPLGLIRLGQV